MTRRGDPVEIVGGSLPSGGVAIDSPFTLAAGVTRASKTCTVANTDYDLGAVIPADTVRILVYAGGNDAVLAVVTTTAANGLFLKADTVYELRVTPGDVLHVRSATAGTVVYVSYLPS